MKFSFTESHLNVRPVCWPNTLVNSKWKYDLISLSQLYELTLKVKVDSSAKLVSGNHGFESHRSLNFLRLLYCSCWNDSPLAGIIAFVDLVSIFLRGTVSTLLVWAVFKERDNRPTSAHSDWVPQNQIKPIRLKKYYRRNQFNPVYGVAWFTLGHRINKVNKIFYFDYLHQTQKMQRNEI